MCDGSRLSPLLVLRKSIEFLTSFYIGQFELQLPAWHISCRPFARASAPFWAGLGRRKPSIGMQILGKRFATMGANVLRFQKGISSVQLQHNNRALAAFQH